MDTIVLVAVWFLGGLLASFGNCIAYRIPRHMNWISGRSQCEKCGHKLNFLELIPVFSCLFLRGRCSSCGEFFGYRHAITELLLGITCVWVYILTSNSNYGFYFVFLVCILYIFAAIVFEGFIYKKKNFDT